jgi:hypothetical protein
MSTLCRRAPVVRLAAAAHGSASALTQGLLAAVRLFPGECHARVKRVLVDFSILHDDDEVLHRICNQLDVRNRIAVDEQRSASAPCSTTPSLPGYGLRLPDSVSSCAFVPVAMASVSAGVYQPMLAILARFAAPEKPRGL